MYYNKFKHLLSVVFILTCLMGNLYASPLKVVAITEDFASIATSIGGDKIEVKSLVKGSRNLHDINPKPSMVMMVRKADLLIRLGMDQDSWIDGLIQVARNNKIFFGKNGYLDCSHEIKKLEIPTTNIDGNMGDVHKSGNPHYWLNPNNGKIIAKEIRDRLIILDPKNEQFYSKNYTSFARKIDIKLNEWQKRMAPYKDFQIVTYHKVWPYFFDVFELHAIGELEPLPGIPPTSRHLMSLETMLKKTNSHKLVLSASFYPRQVGESFSKKIDAKYASVPINVGSLGIKSYIGLFDYLVEEITK
ncbi:metal ABC transporter substrate-binding protein [bacterium]|jgi:zinc/manganese transport system substrate-binding protein|nr:metal ABC transporter substrate-binding protein [bacterium]